MNKIAKIILTTLVLLLGGCVIAVMVVPFCLGDATPLFFLIVSGVLWIIYVIFIVAGLWYVILLMLWD